MARLSHARMGGIAAIALLGATAASAHMPYLLPSFFEAAKADHVTVQAAFGEDAFSPDIVMRDAPYHLIGPDGATIETGPITYLRGLAVFEGDLKTDGTYRLTTGQRLGRKGKMYDVAGKWVMRGEDETPPPAGAREVEVQSTTLAEAYVTRGQPSNGALKSPGIGLQVQPVTHPASIASGTPAAFVLLFDGKPLAGTAVTVFRAAGKYDGRKVATEVTTDAAGRFSVRPQDAGLYLLLARHRAAAPTGSATPYRSYTYTLAFDAA